MTAATIGTLVGLALVDSLNPATIGQAAVLSAGRRPARAVMAFWSGALLTYLVLGTLLIAGPARAIQSVVTDPPGWLRSSCVVLGPVLIAGGVLLLRRLRGRGTRDAAAAIEEPRQGVAFVLGVVTTGVDAFTALPYFAAAAIVVGQDLPFLGKLATLAAYNVVYLMPVLLVLGLRLALRERLDPYVAGGMRVVARVGGPLAGVALVAGGAWLTVVGVRALS